MKRPVLSHSFLLPDRTIMWYVRFECRIFKATDTHSEFVILIVFPLQQLLRECALCIIGKGKGKGLSHNRPSRWPKGVRVG